MCEFCPPTLDEEIESYEWAVKRWKEQIAQTTEWLASDAQRLAYLKAKKRQIEQARVGETEEG